MSVIRRVTRSLTLRSVLLAAERLVRLVEQLLTLARADSALAAAWPEVDLAELAREVVAEIAPGALARGVEIELEPDSPGPVPVRGERGWLAILLRNLIDNAVRHSPQSGVVRVFLQAGAGRVRLEVIDHGPGVPVAQMPRLGQRFWRGEGDASPLQTGSGLGLSIVRRIGELHAAPVSFDAADGGGLRASVLFPPA